MSKIDRAIERMAIECQGKDHLIPFEEYLTSICTTDAVADRILAEDKNLEGAYKAMLRIAQKRKTGNFAYIPPEEGFEIIREYFGIADASQEPANPAPPAGDVIDITAFL